MQEHIWDIEWLQVFECLKSRIQFGHFGPIALLGFRVCISNSIQLKFSWPLWSNGTFWKSEWLKSRNLLATPVQWWILDLLATEIHNWPCLCSCTISDCEGPNPDFSWPLRPNQFWIDEICTFHAKNRLATLIHWPLQQGFSQKNFYTKLNRSV